MVSEDTMFMLKSGVYLLVHRASGKTYVGSSRNLNRRWKEHRRDLRRGTHFNSYLQRAWNRHGEDAFDWQIVEYCEVADLFVREGWWLSLLRATEKSRGYNLGATVVGLCSEESRAKMSSSRKGKPATWNIGRKHTEEARANMGAARRGKKRPPEVAEKVAAALRGLKKSPEHIRNLSISHRGKKPSEETRAKLSAAHTGLKQSAETIEKRRQSRKANHPDGEKALVGRQHSEETKVKMADARKRWWAARQTKEDNQ